jgi:ribosome maturation factor RimP
MQEKIESIVKEACAQKGVALYDLELKPTAHGKVLLVSITSMGGVKVKDCQSVSRIIERQLEEEDLIEGRYFLEVASPGLERDLRKKSHFVSAINEQIKLTVQGEEQNERLKGRLKEVNPSSIILEKDDGEQEEILFSRIKKAKTLYDHRPDLKKSKTEEKLRRSDEH